jgi:hypothetical protein
VDPGAVSSLIVAALAVVISLAAMPYTRRAANAAKAQTELQIELAKQATQPRVWVDVRGNEVDGQMVELVVGNSGPTVATNVSATFDPPLPYSASLRHGEAGPQSLRDGLRSLPPGRELRWPLFVGREFESLVPGRQSLHHVVINADGPAGPLPAFEYDIQLADFAQSRAQPGGSLHDIATTLGEIGKTLKKA